MCLKFKIMFHQTTLILGGFPLLDHQIRQRHDSCGTRDLREVKGQSNYAGCSIGILIMVNNPYISGQYNLLHNLNHWFFSLLNHLLIQVNQTPSFVTPGTHLKGFSEICGENLNGWPNIEWSRTTPNILDIWWIPLKCKCWFIPFGSLIWNEHQFCNL